MNAQTHDRQAQRPGRRMSTVAAKVAKQIAYQVDQFAGLPPAKAWAATIVTVEHVSELVAAQTRSPITASASDVKAELENLVASGLLVRWVDVHGPSARPDRADHYCIAALMGDRLETATSAIIAFDRSHAPALADGLVLVHQVGGLYPPATDVEATADSMARWPMEDQPVARWTALAAGQPVGHASVNNPHQYLTEHLESWGYDPVRTLEVCKVFVAPAGRRHGLGARLLRAALDYAHSQERALALSVVSTSEAAIAMYRSLGMAQVGSFDGRHGLNLVMVSSEHQASAVTSGHRS